MARTIIGAVLQNGRIYKAGDEAALAAVLPRADAERLVEFGVLSDWFGKVAEPTEATGDPGEVTGDGTGTALPPIDDAPAPDADAPDTPPAVAPKAAKAKKTAKKATAKKATKTASKRAS